MKNNRKFSKTMISRKMMTKILCPNFEKSFLECEKIASRKIFRHFLHANFFMFKLLISNHTVFLVQFGINWHKRLVQFELLKSSLAQIQLQIELETVYSQLSLRRTLSGPTSAVRLREVSGL